MCAPLASLTSGKRHPRPFENGGNERTNLQSPRKPEPAEEKNIFPPPLPLLLSCYTYMPFHIKFIKLGLRQLKPTNRGKEAGGLTSECIYSREDQRIVREMSKGLQCLSQPIFGPI